MTAVTISLNPAPPRGARLAGRIRDVVVLTMRNFTHIRREPLRLSDVTIQPILFTLLYRGLGGLSEDYIIGDFEDSDFCHRVRRSGRRNRVALDVALYHLERQSQALDGDAAWRRALTLYNCWLHDRRWGATITKAAA